VIHGSPMSASPTIVILGAGMSGICMGIVLKRAGIDSFAIIEQSPAVGGTWWDNIYPGAQCDVRSHLYSFSFELKSDWSRVFAPSREIQAYVEHCVDKYGLRGHLRLNTTLVEARYDVTDARWLLKTQVGESLTARVFVCSVGPLNRPRFPAGIDAFKGEVMHSSRWNSGYDFTGKRIAIIGSAASAVQIAPSLAEMAAQLTIFQRTPSWVLPRPDRAYTALEKFLLRAPPLARLNRWWHYWVHEARFAAFKGHGLTYRLMTWLADRHRLEQVADPALRDKLRPNYPMGCKRILVTSNYYPALGRPNVRLVAQEAAGFTADGVVAAGGVVHRADAVVCATGFITTELLAGLPVYGAAGATLIEATGDGAQAYKGVTVAGFPNFFMLLGPNTGTGHTSVLIPIEAQARYALKCIQELNRRGPSSMDVRPEVMAEHNLDLQRRMARTVWASPACRSWYKTATGKVVATYPGYITRYVLEMRRPRFADYEFRRVMGLNETR
jgi:cation diffusion facilitator CzcD-associated flavoprotein CzcO